MADKCRVLFVCARNDVRSLMAEALLRHTDSVHFEPYSAGLEASEIDSRTLEALDHIGVDRAGLRSKAIDECEGQPFDYVITSREGAKESNVRKSSRLTSVVLRNALNKPLQ